LNQWLKNGYLLFLGLITVACEDATIDYASDIVGVYIVETATIDGGYTDYSDLPIEEAWIIDITSASLLSYENDVNLCDSTFEIDARVIDSITDTAIIFTDDTRLYYVVEDGQLLLLNNDDIITLVDYDLVFPPLSWTDPALLTNDLYEPDSSLSLSTRLSAAGVIQTHYSAVCDDEDYFIFEALDSTKYIIEASAVGNTDIDLTLSLYSFSGDLVDYNDDQTTSNVDPKLEWICPGTGDYYFVVKKYWDYLDPGNSLDDEKGSYTVSVDVTKNLIKPATPEVVKMPRPQRSTPILHRFFD